MHAVVRIAVVLIAALAPVACAVGRPSAPTDVTTTTATLRGAVDSDRAQTVTWWFEYDTSTAYANATARRQLTFDGRTRKPVSEPIAGLQPGTTYHVRLCAQAPDFDAFCVDPRTFTTQAEPPTELAIAARPALSPAFDPQVTDYATRCTGDPVEVDVEAPDGTGVAVDGGSAQSGRFTESVQLAEGQRFEIAATTGATTESFHVRCLPAGFPSWTFERTSEPSQAWTIVGNGSYVIFVDGHGAPVWWVKATNRALDAKLLSDGNVAFASTTGTGFGALPNTAYELRRLDGSLVRKLQTVGVPTDFHDLQVLPNGNYLILAYRPRDGVDLSAYGKPSNATVLDAEVQELTPAGELVWTWNSKDHLSPAETGRWWGSLGPTRLPDGRDAYDYVHVNAAEPDGEGILLSMRNTDAIYRINRTTGQVLWKLGGTDTAESLDVVGDSAPPNTLGAQHDVRRLADGTVSVYDNRTLLGAPRAARYRIDTAAGTASLVETLADPQFTGSFCCGSARRLDSNGWLLSWGGTPTIAEYAADGSRVFKLSGNPRSPFSYRAVPVPRGRVSADELRNGMDAMFPR